MPPRNATGTKTAHKTSTMATTGPVTSSIAFLAASRGDKWNSVIFRSTFSMTTMASSTTMPMARIIPNRVSMLMENPNSIMPVNVPIMETGTARMGIIVARALCKNRKTTRTTRRQASKKVMTTSLMEARTNVVVSVAMV
ncbi:MAG: hypothetical protein BWX99_02980 [Deltaproteobacteria bacterium ADurb.Bin151]|nr:MAG: hypothetical protein BWX99_02980 [Deltaproteobacteria bacterium ADurb.Bin151]